CRKLIFGRETAMDTDQEIIALHAETLAIQAALTHVLHELSALDPRFAAAIAKGFDQAARLAEDMAISAGKTVPPEHLVKTVRIIEDMRTATLGRHDKPRHGV